MPATNPSRTGRPAARRSHIITRLGKRAQASGNREQPPPAHAARLIICVLRSSVGRYPATRAMMASPVSRRADDLVEARPFHPRAARGQRDRRAEQGDTRLIFFRFRPGDTAKITRGIRRLRPACGAVIFDHPYNDGDARAVIVARVCFAIADSGPRSAAQRCQGHCAICAVRTCHLRIVSRTIKISRAACSARPARPPVPQLHARAPNGQRGKDREKWTSLRR